MGLDEKPSGKESDSSPGFSLVGGTNFATWPDLKWSRGRSHAANYLSRFTEWMASAPLSVDPVLREDRMTVDMVLRVPRGIPTHEWALDFGDSIHNLRSAFDAIAWGYAHYEGLQPEKPKAVAFPVCLEQKQWTRAVQDWVGALPDEFQDRLSIVQPFRSEADGAPSVIELLHALDIRDKHRDSLVVSVGLDNITFSGHYELEDPNATIDASYEMVKNVDFTDGAVLGTLYLGARVVEGNKPVLRPAVKVAFEHEGNLFEASNFLEAAVAHTRSALDILLRGFEPVEPDDESWHQVRESP